MHLSRVWRWRARLSWHASGRGSTVVLVRRARHLRKSKAHANSLPTATCVTTGTRQWSALDLAAIDAIMATMPDDPNRLEFDMDGGMFRTQRRENLHVYRSRTMESLSFQDYSKMAWRVLSKGEGSLQFGYLQRRWLRTRATVITVCRWTRWKTSKLFRY